MDVVQSDALDWLIERDSESVNFIYIDPPFNTGRSQGDYEDSWESPTAYVQWISPILFEARRVLTDKGSICVHLDRRSVHHVAVLLNTVFAVNEPENEIIWCYASGGASRKRLARKHDTILHYSKTGNHTFNVVREPYATPDVEGRAGFHPDGRLLNDWWQMSILSTTSSERVGYATQKPLHLLERIVTLFTRKGDLVVDFFAGSGTTGVACQKLGRDVILVDKNPDAIDHCRARLCLPPITRSSTSNAVDSKTTT